MPPKSKTLKDLVKLETRPSAKRKRAKAVERNAAPPAKEPKKIKAGALGYTIDRVYKLESEAAEIMVAAAKQAQPLNEEAKELRDSLMASFGREDLNGAMGFTAKSEIKQSVVPTVKDWDKVWTYILKTKAFALMQKRLSTEAWRERMSNKQPVPGVDPFTVTTLSVKKR